MLRNNLSRAFGLVRSEDERSTQIERVSYLFTWLLLAQFIMGVGIAIFVSGRPDLNHNWLHSHLVEGALIGAVVTLPAVLLTRLAPRNVFSRHIIANTAILQSLWLIIATGGRIEGHFSVFTVLAIIAFYLDWWLYASVSIIGIGYHCILGHMQPMWVYGVPEATLWRCLEHGLWIFYEVFFLVIWIAIRLGSIRTIVELRLALAEKAQESVDAFSNVQKLKDREGEASDERELERIHRELAFAEKRVAAHHEALNNLLVKALGSKLVNGR